MNGQQNAGAVSMNPEEMADTLAAALETRRQRAERSVIGSFAAQNGMSVGELTRLLEERTRSRQAAAPDARQVSIDERMRAADDRLIRAEIREIGAQLGLVDAQAAFMLMDKTGVRVDEDGNVSGIREALDVLLREKPYLAGRIPLQGTGHTGNFPRNASGGADYVSRLSEARRNGNNPLAAAIIAEAADKGIQLR